MESKDRIKDRLIKTTAKLWNINENEIESNFDPIVKLLIDACSYELEKINADMEASQSRMIEKLVEVILPDAVIGIRPASAIVHAKPSDSEYMTTNVQFKFDKRISQNDTSTKPIYYCPIGQFKLYDAELIYLATKNKIFKPRNYWQKEIVHTISTSKGLSENILLLGIEVSPQIKQLKGLNIYFDYKADHQKELFFSSLKHASCFINQEKVSLKMGMCEESFFMDMSIENMSDNIFQHEQKINKHVYQLYKKNYLHTDDVIYLNEKKSLPLEISDAIEPSFLNTMTPNLLWIQLVFPASLPADILDNVFCNINSFPVVNKKKNEIIYKAQKFINVIPMETNDFYFDIHSIVGSNAYNYHKRNLVSINELVEGEAIVRSSGVGRFDSREARDVIEYLLQIIRDETSTFSEIGGEMVANKMKELNQIIARIEDQMKKVEKKGPTNYLMLKSQKENETIYVDFWTTNGTLANDIKPGTKLILDKGSMLKSDSIYLLTTTLGGRNSMNLEEKINLFRKYLLVKERIVSAEDIRILCHQLFGKKVLKVTVDKGVQYGLDNKTGYTRTIEVNITLNHQIEFQPHEKDYLVNELMIQLENNAGSMLPFHINLL
jgi:hypothetical protein